MDLTTRCPQCGSTFAVSLEQLQLRKGFIRCTSCAHIFDGYDAVVPGEAAPAPVAAIPSVVRQRPVKPPDQAARSIKADLPAPSPSFTISSADAAPSAARAEPIVPSGYTGGPEADGPSIEPALRPGPQSDEHAVAQTVYVEPRRTGAAGNQQPLPDFLNDRHARNGSIVRYFWGVLIIAGLVALLAQAVYVYRAQIANQVPSLRPLLEHACASLNCKVAYARHIQLISIMNSSLRSNAGIADPDKDHHQMTLQATLRNNDVKAQEWPTLTLELVDFSGTVVVRKDLSPSMYLSASALAGPFAPKSEVTATVPVTLNGIKINGYQIGKFFP